MVLEHVVAAGDGIGLEAINRPLGPITVRNSILRGKFLFIRGVVVPLHLGGWVTAREQHRSRIGGGGTVRG